MSAVQYLDIRSADRINQNSDTGSFSVNLRTPIYKAKGVSLAHSAIPNVLPNISTALANNTLSVTVGATTYPLTFTDGNYTATTFATVLQSALENAVANAWDVIFDTTTFYTTIAGTAAFSLNFATTPGIGKRLGWHTAANVGPATTITSPYAWNFSEPYSYYLRLDIPSAIISTTASAEVFNFKLPTSGNNGDLFQFNRGSEFDMQGSGGEFNITKIGVQLVDANGTVVNMKRINWEITLEIKYCCKDIPKVGCNGK